MNEYNQGLLWMSDGCITGFQSTPGSEMQNVSSLWAHLMRCKRKVMTCFTLSLSLTAAMNPPGRRNIKRGIRASCAAGDGFCSYKEIGMSLRLRPLFLTTEITNPCFAPFPMFWRPFPLHQCHANAATAILVMKCNSSVRQHGELAAVLLPWEASIYEKVSHRSEHEMIPQYQILLWILLFLYWNKCRCAYTEAYKILKHFTRLLLNPTPL